MPARHPKTIEKPILLILLYNPLSNIVAMISNILCEIVAMTSNIYADFSKNLRSTIVENYITERTIINLIL